MQLSVKNEHLEKAAKVAAWVAIAVGIILRFIMYYQDRNLIIDEANIVRNLFERGFVRLLAPLDYEQYAPPVFLWVEKLLSMTFGFSAKALKLFPMACGIGMLFLYYDILKRLINPNIVWLPLALLAFSPYFIEFSATIKQYISDSLIVLLLLWVAIRTDIFEMQRRKFVLLWGMVGVLAIYSSMPSVFALAAVGFYYAWQVFRKKSWNYIPSLTGMAAIWLGAFAIYYFIFLKPQIESDYLQNYHADYFLFALPKKPEEWQHNWMRIREIINNACGYSSYNFWAACVLLPLGVFALMRKRLGILILILTPVLLTLFAAALNQFSLIQRVSLFLLPLVLLLFSLGLNELWNIRLIVVKLSLVILGFMMIKTFNGFDIFTTRHGFHEITEGFDYLLSKKVEGRNLFVHNASKPTYLYYTAIDPKGREKYASLLGAHLMNWDSDFAVETKELQDTTYFIYTGGFPEPEKQKCISQIETNMKQIDYFEKYVCFVYGYVPKSPDTTQK